MVLYTFLERLGCFVDTERAVPCLFRVDGNGVVTEAILDVVMSLPGGLLSSYFDVTIRCPHSVRNAHGHRLAALKPSVAAADGELEKLTRYGSQVQPVSFETYGRLGRASLCQLRSLAMKIATHFGRAGRWNGTSLYGALRTDLERCLCREIADTTLRSLGQSSGLHARRR
eukprot:10688968-Karenia_brevis.AAC.1